MITFDHVFQEETKEHNPNFLPKIPDNPCRILVICGYGSRKKIII